MVDNLTKEQRRKNMQAIRSQSQLENLVSKALWHGCPLHGNKPLTNQEYWGKKLHKNIKRDVQVTQYYIDNNWHILRIWEHDVKQNFEDVINKINEFIADSKNIVKIVY